MRLQQMTFAWRTIFKNWRYTALAILIAIAFFILNVIILNFQSIRSFSQVHGFFDAIKFTYTLSLGFPSTVTGASFITLIIISILLGMLFSIVAFKTTALRMGGKNLGPLSTIGIFLGIAAPGCAACGIGLLAAFGISASLLTLLPLKGLEISLLAIIMLGYSTWHISKDLLECKSCKTMLKTQRKVKGGRKHGR